MADKYLEAAVAAAYQKPDAVEKPWEKEEVTVSSQSSEKVTRYFGIKKKYLVALCCGGVMEDPRIHYENHEIIEARCKREAEDIYNKKHNCRYYYAEALSVVLSDKVKIPVSSLLHR